jgi:N-acyl-D-amino-acid deacylase
MNEPVSFCRNSVLGRMVFCGGFLFLFSCSSHHYDVIIRNGMIFDGSGGHPYQADLAILNDTIAYIGDLSKAHATKEIDANGRAITPGFINMLSWANESLIQNGESKSDILQGVTTEIMGEGNSMGPWNDSMKAEALRNEGDIKYPITWTTLGEYLSFLEKKGIACNVGSFVGAATLRVHEVGYADRDPTPDELNRMCDLARVAMREGAMGVSSALIYAPAFYAKTPELIALCKAVGEYGGMYISHMRSEGNNIDSAVNELIFISHEANVPAEIYHYKTAGVNNWSKLGEITRKINEAKNEGLNISANMYTYTAGGTGLYACLPPWVQAGGTDSLLKRLNDPAIRRRVIHEMKTPTDQWENLLLASGSPDSILLISFVNDSLKKYQGKTLGDVARLRNKSPEETILDLIAEDRALTQALYFIISEKNIQKEIQIPWMSFGSDEGSYSDDTVFYKSGCHPRAYGNFARVISVYSRDEKLISLQEAIRKLSALPAQSLKLQKRGVLKAGYYADVLIFNPNHIEDPATYPNPRQYASGMDDVFVNGKQVLDEGKFTGFMPGRFLKGPGYGRK